MSQTIALKLDENLGRSAQQLLSAAGHDVATVHDQGMSSASDGSLLEACAAERRCLVSLDLDFANPMRFDPRARAGIVVLRPPDKVTPTDLRRLIERLIEGLQQQAVEGRLWIVQRGGIREYEPPD